MLLLENKKLSCAILCWKSKQQNLKECLMRSLRWKQASLAPWLPTVAVFCMPMFCSVLDIHCTCVLFKRRVLHCRCAYRRDYRCYDGTGAQATCASNGSWCAVFSSQPCVYVARAERRMVGSPQLLSWLQTHGFKGKSPCLLCVLGYSCVHLDQLLKWGVVHKWHAARWSIP